MASLATLAADIARQRAATGNAKTLFGFGEQQQYAGTEGVGASIRRKRA
jgi:hypothetical protein